MLFLFLFFNLVNAQLDLESSHQTIDTVEPNVYLEYSDKTIQIKSILYLSCVRNCTIKFKNCKVNFVKGGDLILNGFNVNIINSEIKILDSTFSLHNCQITGNEILFNIDKDGILESRSSKFSNIKEITISSNTATSKISAEDVIFQAITNNMRMNFLQIIENPRFIGIKNVKFITINVRNLVSIEKSKAFFYGISITDCKILSAIFSLNTADAQIVSTKITNSMVNQILYLYRTSNILLRDVEASDGEYCLMRKSNSNLKIHIFVNGLNLKNITCNTFLIQNDYETELIMDRFTYSNSKHPLLSFNNMKTFVVLKNSKVFKVIYSSPICSLMIYHVYFINTVFEEISNGVLDLRVDKITIDKMNMTRNNGTAITFSKEKENTQQAQQIITFKLLIEQSTSTFHIIFQAKITSYIFSFYNCTFTKNNGSIIRVATINEAPNQKMRFQSCHFSYNKAYSGTALFCSALSGNYFFDNSDFHNNYASNYGGIAYFNTEDTVYFTFRDCRFIGNNAKKGGGVFFNTVGSLNMSKTLFQNNSAEYASDIDNAGYGKLWLNNSIFENSIIKSKASFIGRGESTIYFANITFNNCTSEKFTAGIFLISNIQAFLYNISFNNLSALSNSVLYFSNNKMDKLAVILKNVTLKNCVSKSNSLVKIFSSYTKIENITGLSISNNFFSFFYAKVILKGANFNDSLVSLQFSEIEMSDFVVFTKISQFIVEYTTLVINNGKVRDYIDMPLKIYLFSFQQSTVKIFNSVIDIFAEITIYSIYTIVEIRGSSISRPFTGIKAFVSHFIIDNSTFITLRTTGISFQDFNYLKSSLNITNSVFSKTVVSAIVNFIIIKNSDIYMQNITFDRIFFYKNILELERANFNGDLNWIMSDFKFINSRDQGSNMIILWINDKAPQIRSIDTRVGKRLVSTPPLFIHMNESLDTFLLPGKSSSKSLIIHLKDYYNQTLTYINVGSAEINIYLVNSSKAFIQNRVSELSSGVFKFSNLSISAERNTNITLEISTNVIPNYSNLLNDLNLSKSIHVNIQGKYKFLVNVTIGNCTKGQVYFSSLLRCTDCPAGKYSLDPQNDNFCKNCPVNAKCPGLGQVIVDSGYWKLPSSMIIVKCTQAANCPGGHSTNNLCNEGYEAPMCSVCSKGYFRGFKFQCSLCGSKELFFSYLISSSFLIFLVSYHTLMVKMKIQSKRIITTVIIKIFIDHLQLSNLLSNLEVPWSLDFFQFFRVANSVNDPYFLMFGIDCILERVQINGLTTVIKKLLLFGMFSLIVPIIVGIVWLIISKRRKYDKKKFKKYFAITLIILFYAFQPTYITKFFEPNICFKLGTSTESFMKPDMNIKCWSNSHIYILLFSTPFLVSWAILIPAFLFIKLMRCNKEIEARKRLEIPYYYMSKGYRLKFKYWDFLVMFQKVLAITIIAFAKDSFFASFFVLGLFIFFLILQIMAEPYASTIAHYLCLHSRIAFVCNIIAAISLKQKDVFPIYVPYMILGIACVINFSFFIVWFLSYVKVRFGILKYFNLFGLNEYRNIIDSIAMKYKIVSNLDKKEEKVEMKTRGTKIMQNTEIKLRSKKNNPYLDPMTLDSRNSQLRKDPKLKSLAKVLSKSRPNMISNKLHLNNEQYSESREKRSSFFSFFKQNKDKISQIHHKGKSKKIKSLKNQGKNNNLSVLKEIEGESEEISFSMQRRGSNRSVKSEKNEIPIELDELSSQRPFREEIKRHYDEKNKFEPSNPNADPFE